MDVREYTEHVATEEAGMLAQNLLARITRMRVEHQVEKQKLEERIQEMEQTMMALVAASGDLPATE